MFHKMTKQNREQDVCVLVSKLNSKLSYRCKKKNNCFNLPLNLMKFSAYVFYWLITHTWKLFDIDWYVGATTATNISDTEIWSITWAPINIKWFTWGRPSEWQCCGSPWCCAGQWRKWSGGRRAVWPGEWRWWFDCPLCERTESQGGATKV